MAQTGASMSARGRNVQPAFAQRARRELGPGCGAESFEQSPQVRLDGLGADPEGDADLVVAATLDDEPYDLQLAAGEVRGHRSRPNAEREATGRGATNRVEELRERRGL